MLEHYTEQQLNDIDKLLGAGHRKQGLVEAFIEWHGVSPSESPTRYNEYIELITHLAGLGCLTFYEEEYLELLIKGRSILEIGGFSAYLDYLNKPSKNQEALMAKQKELITLQVTQLKKELNIQLSENQNLFYQQSTEKLRAEMSSEAKAIEKRLKAAQLEFFKTSIVKNQTYIFMIYVSFGTSLVVILLKLLELWNQ